MSPKRNFGAERRKRSPAALFASVVTPPNAARRAPAYWLFTLSLIAMMTSAILLLSECGERAATTLYWRGVAARRARTEDQNWTQQDMAPRFQSLYAQNSDIVGWLSAPDVGVNYPVMQTPDAPEYYLDRDFDRQKTKTGAPFADYRCQVTPDQGFNTVIYAHDTMLFQLNQYTYLKNYYAQHPYLRFDTLTETGYYEVAAAFYADATGARLLDPWDPDDPQAYEPYNYLEVDSLQGFQKFCDAIRQRQLFPTDVSISPRSRILTLLCCATEPFSGIPDNNGRLVVIAVRTGP